MIIKNADVYTEDAGFVKKDIFIEGSFFAENLMDCEDRYIIDAADCYAIPALTDIHFHGCAGSDFSDGNIEAIENIAEYEASVGVANIVPATMTLSEDELINICATAGAYISNRDNMYSLRHKTDKAYTDITNKRPSDKKARIQGINLEGPFISPAKKGAQNEKYIKMPDISLINKLNNECNNMIKIISLAPELDGAMEFIEKLHNEVIISLAHTDTDYDTALRAFKKGASHVTHLFNAMRPFTHREPNLIGAAADTDYVDVELIGDGVHVHPAAVRTAFKIFGADRIIFISDSMRATGLGDGDYTLGGQAVTVNGNRALLKDGTIAGSVTNLMECMRIAVTVMGISLGNAVKCAAVNPAKCLGIYDKYGSIEPGKAADIVLLRKSDLKPVKIIMNGALVM